MVFVGKSPRSLEKEMATHSSILAWRIPRTEEPGQLQSMGSQRVGHNWACKYSHTHTHTPRHLAQTSLGLSKLFVNHAFPNSVPHSHLKQNRSLHGAFHLNVSYLKKAPLSFPPCYSSVPQTGKNLSAMQETRVRSLYCVDPLEKGMANHSSLLAWRIPWKRILAG